MYKATLEVILDPRSNMLMGTGYWKYLKLTSLHADPCSSIFLFSVNKSVSLITMKKMLIYPSNLNFQIILLLKTMDLNFGLHIRLPQPQQVYRINQKFFEKVILCNFLTTAKFWCRMKIEKKFRDTKNLKPDNYVKH